MMHNAVWYNLYVQSKTAATFIKIQSRKVVPGAEK